MRHADGQRRDGRKPDKPTSQGSDQKRHASILSDDLRAVKALLKNKPHLGSKPLVECTVPVS